MYLVGKTTIPGGGGGGRGGHSGTANRCRTTLRSGGGGREGEAEIEGL